MNARYYPGATARFLSQDTWEGDFEDPQSLNKYSYTRNNPLKYVDPSGNIFDTPSFNQHIRPSIESFVNNATDRTSQLAQRVAWGTGAVLTSPVVPQSSFLLLHSLQDDPKDLYFGNDSSFANTVRNNTDYRNYIDKILSGSQLENESFSYDSNESGIPLIFDDKSSLSGIDLFSGIHRVSGGVSIDGSANNNAWDLNANLSDIYDYTYDSSSGGGPITSFFRWLNNLATKSFGDGAINSYEIHADFSDKKTMDN